MTKAICCLRKFQHSFLLQFFFLSFNNWIKSKWVRTNGNRFNKKSNTKRNIWQLSHWNCVPRSILQFWLLFSLYAKPIVYNSYMLVVRLKCQRTACHRCNKVYEIYGVCLCVPNRFHTYIIHWINVMPQENLWNRFKQIDLYVPKAITHSMRKRAGIFSENQLKIYTDYASTIVFNLENWFDKFDRLTH